MFREIALSKTLMVPLSTSRPDRTTVQIQRSRPTYICMLRHIHLKKDRSPGLLPILEDGMTSQSRESP